ncbi:MAG TPA: glycosyl transferase [Anaerolineaceae bacterium]|nr:MAG: Putative glycosyltransferase [Anaerolineae bacterium 49_20]HAE85608.1 glycosyl transferase [Anaerolineaceae bacterium]
MDTPFLSLIIPAHNEAKRLEAALQQVESFIGQQVYSVEVILVENASSDATVEIAQSWQPRMPQLRLLCLEQPGKGNAVRAGMLAARGAYRFMADTDFSMPIAEINRFFPYLEAGADIAIGSREAPGARRIGEPYQRHLVGRVFNTLVRWLVLPSVQDTQCGFKCFTAAAAEAVFPKQTLEGWSFDVEVLVIGRELGLKIQEVPITWIYDAGSRVNVLRDSLRMARDLLYIRRQARRGVYRADQI